jgi:hypothetical protein
MTEAATICDHCGRALSGSHEGVPWEVDDDGTGGTPAHSHNRCRHLLRDDLKEARAALREMSSLLQSQGIKEWRMTSSGRATLFRATQEKP